MMPYFEPETAPQWVRDVVENLRQEHDDRVTEYLALEALLPNAVENGAIRHATTTLREKGHGYVADILAGYIDRLGKAGSRCGV